VAIGMCHHFKGDDMDGHKNKKDEKKEEKKDGI